MNYKDLDDHLITNTIRFLSAEAITKANSGHPGLPLGTAAMAYTIWSRHLRINPGEVNWINRDRFVLSGGHGSMLLYSLLHLAGFDLSLDDLKDFRQWQSKTPGHPEFGWTEGVETTTGPLGQGLANGVGMAIAEAHLAARFNKAEHKLIDHFIYGVVTDGDLMEGVSSEAASLAGHLKLGKLIYLYDDNQISIDGSTELAFTEDRGKRFEAYGWHVSYIEDGNAVEDIDSAIQAAKQDERPSLIICKTQIGFGMPNRQGTAKAHGEPPGAEELKAMKENLGWPQEPAFYVPEEAQAFKGFIKEKGAEEFSAWNIIWASYQEKYPEDAAEFNRVKAQELPTDWDEDLPIFEADTKGLATRASSGKVLNHFAVKIPDLIGGSADLAPSNKTWISDSDSFQAGAHDHRNLHFGVREHGMASILNGMSLYPGIIPFGGTFLVFADYLRGALRVAALSHMPVIYVLTHDSIGVGEDGPTHQPVETLASLRIIPNLVTLRPADANEVVQSWKIAIERRDGPTALALTRQALPTLDRTAFASAEGTAKGAYILKDYGGEPELILLATGSEVSLIVESAEKLAADGVKVRVVSMPSWELFAEQTDAYQESVLPKAVSRRLAVEAGVSFGWERWVGLEGDVIGIDRYGASAPASRVFQEFGFTVENVVNKARMLLND